MKKWERHTLDSKVRLVRERTREVVRADLVGRDKRVGDQELCPLVEQVELSSRSLVNYAS